MIADRHPLVVRQQRRIGAEQLADVRRVIDRRVEVGVVADTRGHRVFDMAERSYRHAVRSAFVGCAGPQRARQRTRRSDDHADRTLRHECVERGGVRVAERFGTTDFAMLAREPATARRSSTRSPIGTPIRNAWASGCVATPSGERCRTAGSGSGSRSRPRSAEATQLRSVGSCVSLSRVIGASARRGS